MKDPSEDFVYATSTDEISVEVTLITDSSLAIDAIQNQGVVGRVLTLVDCKVCLALNNDFAQGWRTNGC